MDLSVIFLQHLSIIYKNYLKQGEIQRKKT